MKKFLTFTLFYSVLLAIFFGIPLFSNMATPEFPPRNMNFNLHYNNSFVNKERSDVIILGNSRSLSSLDSDILTKMTNLSVRHLGFSSSSPQNNYYTLQAFIDSVGAPKTIVYEVSWMSFSKKRLNTNRKHLYDVYYYLKEKSPLQHSFDMGFYIEYTLRFYKQYRVPYKKNKNFGYSNHLNQQPKNMSFLEKKSILKILEKNSLNLKQDKVYLDFFHKIINLVIENKINLILYTAPESKELVEMQKDRMNHLSLFYKLADRYNNIKYLNFAPKGEFYESRFRNFLKDSHHLINPQEFSEIFAKHIR